MGLAKDHGRLDDDCRLEWKELKQVDKGALRHGRVWGLFNFFGMFGTFGDFLTSYPWLETYPKSTLCQEKA